MMDSRTFVNGLRSRARQLSGKFNGGRAALRALAVGDGSLFVEPDKTLADLNDQVTKIFAGGAIPADQHDLLERMTQIGNERSAKRFVRAVRNSSRSTIEQISAIADLIEESGGVYDSDGQEVDMSSVEARNEYYASQRAVARESTPANRKNTMPKTNQTSTITLQSLRDKAAQVLGGEAPKRLPDMISLIRGKAMNSIGADQVALLDFEGGSQIDLASRLLDALSPTNAPSFAPSPAPTAASAPAYRAHQGAPSLDLLKKLADVVFGRGTAKRECMMPFVAGSPADRALLSKDIYSANEHARNVVEYERRTRARQPSAQQIEAHERECLTKLFYRTGVQVPGLSFAGLKVSSAEFGKIELTESQLKLAQSRADDFFKTLAGGRFHGENRAAEAAVDFMRGGSASGLMTVPDPTTRL